MSDFVSKREYSKLLQKVIDLEDTIIKLKRNLEDELENLDIDNFSESFKVKQDKASLEITKTAKELSVKMEDYDTSMVKMQSEIKQTASSIETRVLKLSAEDKKLESLIKQNAGNILLRVTKSDVEKMISNAEFTVDVDGIKSEVKDYADGQISTAAETITAESITQTVSRAFFEVEKISVPFDDKGKDTDKIYYCSVNGMHYYYNSIAEEWRETSSKSIYSAFVQTDDGFEFNGDVVKISGDLITGGTLSGSALKNSSGNITLTLGEDQSGNYGDLTLFAPGRNPDEERQVFQIYDGGGQTTFKVGDAGFLSSYGYETYPLGNWDFSNCGYVKFPDGVGGGTGGVAVFG